MEANLSNIVFSSTLLLITIWVLKATEWVWFKPKRLKRRLRSLGFCGQPYKFLHGNQKEIALMTRQSNSKPMDHFSNDCYQRIMPFYYQTIKDYGEGSFVWEGPIPTILVTKPEMMREIMMKIHEFEKPITHPLLVKLSVGLSRLEGQKWAQDRKLINPAFHTDKLKHMLSAFEVSCNGMIDEWEEKAGGSGGGFEIDIWPSLHDMSADAISRAAFGTCFREGKRVFELLRQQLAIIVHVLQSVYIPGSRFLPTKTNKRAAKINNEIETLLRDMILKRCKAMEAGDAPKDDLLGILLKSCHQGYTSNKNEKNDIKLSLKQVIEECKLFYIAGQGTTSTLLVWTLILLGKYKDWQELARREVFDKFGNNNEPDFNGLNDLKKVNMILQEVLRLYPPITSVVRKVKHDTKIGDMLFPSGVQLHLPFVYVQHDEKLWGCDAKEFNPDRFSEGVLKATQGNMSLFSFGWGPRICIGSNFAMLEAKLTLVAILQRFTFELSPSYVHAPTTSSGALRPQFGAQLTFHHI